jgi:hypothetical protein
MDLAFCAAYRYRHWPRLFAQCAEISEVPMNYLIRERLVYARLLMLEARITGFKICISKAKRGSQFTNTLKGINSVSFIRNN